MIRLLITIAAVVLVGCGESQESTTTQEAKPVAQSATPEPKTAKATDISIHEAAGTGNIEAVKKHLDAGTDVNAKNSRNWPPLHLAVSGGHKEIVELLIAKGADINARDISNMTPLDEANRLAKHNFGRSKEIADLLRKHGGKMGADFDIHLAVRSGNAEAVKQHLADGVDVNAKNKRGVTPLHYAAEGHREILELLIANGADVHAKSNEGTTPLDRAVSRKNKETTDLLLKLGGKHGTIHGAALGGDIEAVKEFLAAGTDVNAKGNREETILHHVADAGHKEIAELLIAKGADVNAKDNDGGTTPLHHAASYGRNEVVELLIAKGADVNAKDNYGGTPLDRAISSNKKSTASFLRKHSGKTGEELKAEGK